MHVRQQEMRVRMHRAILLPETIQSKLCETQKVIVWRNAERDSSTLLASACQRINCSGVCDEGIPCINTGEFSTLWECMHLQRPVFGTLSWGVRGPNQDRGRHPTQETIRGARAERGTRQRKNRSAEVLLHRGSLDRCTPDRGNPRHDNGTHHKNLLLRLGGTKQKKGTPNLLQKHNVDSRHMSTQNHSKMIILLPKSIHSIGCVRRMLERVSGQR